MLNQYKRDFPLQTLPVLGRYFWNLIHNSEQLPARYIVFYHLNQVVICFPNLHRYIKRYWDMLEMNLLSQYCKMQTGNQSENYRIHRNLRQIPVRMQVTSLSVFGIIAFVKLTWKGRPDASSVIALYVKISSRSFFPSRGRVAGILSIVS